MTVPVTRNRAPTYSITVVSSPSLGFQRVGKRCGGQGSEEMLIHFLALLMKPVLRSLFLLFSLNSWCCFFNFHRKFCFFCNSRAFLHVSLVIFGYESLFCNCPCLLIEFWPLFLIDQWRMLHFFLLFLPSCFRGLHSFSHRLFGYLVPRHGIQSLHRLVLVELLPFNLVPRWFSAFRLRSPFMPLSKSHKKIKSGTLRA